MATLIQTIFNCFTGTETIDEFSDEKQAILSYERTRTAEKVAEDVVQTILHVEKGGKDLRRTLDAVVGTYGWTEKVAEWILVKLEKVLREGSKLSPYLKEAYDKAWKAAKEIEGFVKEHPVFCTVMALGVLVIITPWVIEALGFAELGPVEGSFAAWWQARYAGLVPKGSLFSFFQRLGMTWH